MLINGPAPVSQLDESLFPESEAAWRGPKPSQGLGAHGPNIAAALNVNARYAPPLNSRGEETQPRPLANSVRDWGDRSTAAMLAPFMAQIAVGRSCR
jgi:hypothetical protein